MALFDKLLGSNSEKIRLIRELTRFRIRTDPTAQLMSIDPNQVDSLTKSQLMMLPEASIATIVETYTQLTRRGASAQSALSQIDAHRASGFGSERSTQTSNLFDYVADRMRIENDQSVEMDQAFIDSAVFTSAKVFGMEIELPKRPTHQIIREFYISSFRVVIAKYRVREDGYLFPWRLMAFDSGAEQFTFSYNLELSPITCGLGSHTSDGAHRTFEEGDPNMTEEEFEAWAVPLAIDHIAAIEEARKPKNIATSELKRDPDPYLASESMFEQFAFNVELQNLDQAFDEGEIDRVEYGTKRNKLFMDLAVNSCQSTNFNHEHAMNVIAFDDDEISLGQLLENYRALLLSEVSKVLMDRLKSAK